MQSQLTREYVVSSLVNFFYFGLLAIGTAIPRYRQLVPIILSDCFINTALSIVTWLGHWLLIVVTALLGLAAVFWSFFLLTVLLCRSLLRDVENVRWQKIRLWNDFLYWPALVVNFAASLYTALGLYFRGGVSPLIVAVLVVIALLMLIGLTYIKLLTSRRFEKAQINVVQHVASPEEANPP